MKSTWDVLIVGAGSAGATAALHLARAGRRVLVLDARALDEAGAQWVNGVPGWMFDRAGVARPSDPPELRSAPARHVIVDPGWEHRVVLPRSPLLSVDMRHLIARLQREARAAGATLTGRTPVRDVLLEGERVVGVRTPEGEVRARFVIDASGLAGVVRSKVPALRAECPAPRASDVCSAAQEVRRIADLDGARRWIAAHGAPGDALGVVGLEGGFSTRNVNVDLRSGEVDILTGAIAERGRMSGPELLDAFVRAQPWVGEKVFGGSGAIPLRRPFDRLSAPGVALIGDAACQVFPAHGSGVGAGMIAARVLAEALLAHAPQAGDGAHDPGVRYEATFHRATGALLAAYDVFRRLSQDLSAEDLAGMFAAGLIDPVGFEAGLSQRMPVLGARDVLRLGAAATRAPRLAARFGPAVVRMRLAHALYRARPRRRELLFAWSRAAERLVDA
ncbi:MAG: FAD-dependent oxidoreductase [Deltaproteobacteria bacterium]|nr:FAD-dependent oxidoreductase [Deltaproteobacteria bacterium]